MPSRLTVRLVALVVAVILAGATTALATWHDATPVKAVQVRRGREQAAAELPAPVTTTSTSSTEPASTATAAPPPPASATTAARAIAVAAAASAPQAPQAPQAGAAGPGGSLKGKVIAIDPGHNGANWAHPGEINRLVPAGGFSKPCDTTGTVNTVGYTESAFNLDVASRLAQDLQRQGATVVLTRTSDNGWGPCVNERAAIGNRAHADAAISIHADGAPPGGHGFDVLQPALVPGYTDAIVGPSHLLALAVRNNFGRATGMPPADYAGVNGIDTRSDLGGLNLSTVPKVFVECGNMRNAVDSGLQTDPGWRQRVADGLALALTGFLHGVTS